MRGGIVRGCWGCRWSGSHPVRWWPPAAGNLSPVAPEDAAAGEFHTAIAFFTDEHNDPGLVPMTSLRVLHSYRCADGYRSQWACVGVTIHLGLFLDLLGDLLAFCNVILPMLRERAAEGV